MTAIQSSAKDSSFVGGIVLTAHASAHTKAETYTELISSTNADSTWVSVVLQRGNTSAATYLVDIGIGAASSEVVKIPDLIFAAGGSTEPGFYVYEFPLVIPSGSRLSALCQSSTGSATCRASIHVGFDPHPFVTGDTVEAFGVNAGTTGAVALDDSGIAGTYGDWTEIEDSLANGINGFSFALSHANTTNVATRYLMFGIATGAAESESEIIDEVMASNNSALDTYCPGVSPYLPLSIGSGVRVSGRYKTIDNASANTYEMALYGLRTA